ncbi:hypothetical protein [Paenibacillus sp. Y412MC10]|nr:hypothetical protein [Paenibacillus sp. Y412MC10]
MDTDHPASLLAEEDVIDAYEANRENWEDSAPETIPTGRLSFLACASI